MKCLIVLPLLTGCMSQNISLLKSFDDEMYRCSDSPRDVRMSEKKGELSLELRCHKIPQVVTDYWVEL